MRDSDDFIARVTDNRIRPAAHGSVLSFAREKALKTVQIPLKNFQVLP